MERTAGSTSWISKRPQAARIRWASEVERVAAMARSEGSCTRTPFGVTLGRVVGAHGLRGEVRVRLVDPNANPLQAVTTVWLGREERDPNAAEARVLAVGSGRRGEARVA